MILSGILALFDLKKVSHSGIDSSSRRLKTKEQIIPTGSSGTHEFSIFSAGASSRRPRKMREWAASCLNLSAQYAQAADRAKLITGQY
jgi:hypothetical protein